MNWGKVAVLAILGSAVAVGGGVWYAQEYAYYDRIDPADVTLEVTAGGQQVALAVADIQAIDAGSAPHRWRACFRVTEALPGDAEPYADPTPLYGPGWFDCFDAEQIGHDLESGAATAWLGQSEIAPDVDRVIAVYPDGRAYGWHQINDKTPERGVMD
ncbi:DUF6446 family protein [Paracoccus sp. SCSIO 75233]|uniref:DUF6446 family protein n=1 Tax=Paracoccus sp. SCSIO 75233 TaxID=3017782 RepID=UPI0022F116DB|nr:DUF6446 family protein [Paracoccus sp. SCSIO 75233]WBU54520.1 DUF6446 family protein [Paracoccus sp. SCSIO 75233]